MDLLLIIQSLIAISLIILIVIQAKGTGLGHNFGTTNYHSKRGLEKSAFYITIILSILFIFLSIKLAI